MAAAALQRVAQSQNHERRQAQVEIGEYLHLVSIGDSLKPEANHPAFKKTVPALAWGSFAWCYSEADHLMIFDGADSGTVTSLRDFLPSEK